MECLLVTAGAMKINTGSNSNISKLLIRPHKIVTHPWRFMHHPVERAVSLLEEVTQMHRRRTFIRIKRSNQLKIKLITSSGHRILTVVMASHLVEPKLRWLGPNTGRVALPSKAISRNCLPKTQMCIQGNARHLLRWMITREVVWFLEGVNSLTGRINRLSAWELSQEAIAGRQLKNHLSSFMPHLVARQPSSCFEIVP